MQGILNQFTDGPTLFHLTKVLGHEELISSCPWPYCSFLQERMAINNFAKCITFYQNSAYLGVPCIF